jgi:hypothetical protein
LYRKTRKPAKVKETENNWGKSRINKKVEESQGMGKVREFV